MEQEHLYPLQLLDVRLYTANIERLTEETAVDEGEEEQESAPPFFLGLDLSIVRHREQQQASVFLTLHVKGPDARRPEFHLNFTLEGLFEVQCDWETLSPEVWEEFEHISAMTLLWPYAREYLHSFARRMRVELPVLPTLNRLSLKRIPVTNTSTDL